VEWGRRLHIQVKGKDEVIRATAFPEVFQGKRIRKLDKRKVSGGKKRGALANRQSMVKDDIWGCGRKHFKGAGGRKSSSQGGR